MTTEGKPESSTGGHGLSRERRAYWARLTELLDRVESAGFSRLSGAEVLELGQLYRRAAADLATVYSHAFDEGTVHELNRLVTRAHGAVYVTERSGLRSVVEFLWHGFPSLVHQRRGFILTATAVFALGALCAVLWPPLGSAMVPDTYRTPRISAGESPLGTAFITGNNVRVAMLAFAGGVSLGGLTLYVLFMNGAMVGGVSALIGRIGEGAKFWPSVYPHGIIELTAIMIAAGAGLRLGWAVLCPGEVTRAEAVREAGRDAIRLAVGTVPLFVVAGTIEGYVSFSGLPAWLKLAVGTLAAAALAAYLSRGRLSAAESPPGGITR